jgi:hypothetical protein
MNYNLAENSIIYSNTTSGTVSLQHNEMRDILDGIGTSALSPADVLVVDCDLGLRLHVAKLSYSFVPEVSGTLSALDVLFQYKNEFFQDYTSLATFIENDTFCATYSGTDPFSPRYIRMSHMVTESGTANSFSVTNDDTVVDFGQDGSDTEQNIEIARGGTEDIRTIPVYNSGTTKADAIVNVEPTYTDLDQVLSISLSQSGPWTGVFDTTNKIADADDFDYGDMTSAEVDGVALRLTGFIDRWSEYSSRHASATYLTKVFESSGNNTRIILDKDVSSLGYIAVDEDDATETIEVISSPTAPKNYSVFRELYQYNSGNYDYVVYRDRWTETGSVKETSSWGFISCDYRSEWVRSYMVTDPDNDRWAGFAYHNTTDNYSRAELYLFNNVGTSSNQDYRICRQNSAGDYSISWSMNEMVLDDNGGSWISFYCPSFSSSDFVDATGHYLVYFDSSLTNQFKYFSASEFVGNMDVNKEDGILWWTNPSATQIQKLNNTGTVILNYSEPDYTGELGGICVDTDGVWFSNKRSIHKLDFNGNLLESATLDEITSEYIDYMKLDVSDSNFMWIISDNVVSRIYLNGEMAGEAEFSITMTSPTRLDPVNSGCWVWCVDAEDSETAYYKYISTVNKRIDRNYTTRYASKPAPIEYAYTHKNYASKMPISVDTVWSNLEWRKISTDSYLVSEDTYVQAKITLRRATAQSMYPGLSEDKDYRYTDYFSDPDGPVANIQLWDRWTNDINVYIENNKLILKPGAYIDTYQQTFLAPDGNDDWNVQFDYTLGDGTKTGLTERIRLIAYSVDSTTAGNALYVQLDQPYNCDTSGYSYVRTYRPGGSTTYSLSSGYDRWTGKLRLYYNSGTLYGYVWDPNQSSWRGNSLTDVSSYGSHFYIRIDALSTGSTVTIDNFTMSTGYRFYKTETPSLYGIYLQKPLELEDIYPSNYKNIYLKSQAASSLSLTDNQEADLRVRWEIPVT